MKTYRLTKIRIKTREIISVANRVRTENQTPVCPVCHTPLAAELSPINENNELRDEANTAANLSKKFLT